ncbi:unnamed protein product [Boreogadus saida]
MDTKEVVGGWRVVEEDPVEGATSLLWYLKPGTRQTPHQPINLLRHCDVRGANGVDNSTMLRSGLQAIMIG